VGQTALKGPTAEAFGSPTTDTHIESGIGPMFAACNRLLFGDFFEPLVQVMVSIANQMFYSFSLGLGFHRMVMQTIESQRHLEIKYSNKLFLHSFIYRVLEINFMISCNKTVSQLL